MSVFYTIAIVVLGLIIVGSIFYISFKLENAQQRKALLASKAADRMQKYHRFLNCFEEGVLPKDVKLVLIEEVLHNLRSMRKLDAANPRTARLLEEAESQHQQILKSESKPAKVPKARNQAAVKEIQLQFKNLFRLLNHIGKTRKVHAKTINKNLKILQSLFVETGVTLHRNIAEAAIQQEKHKLAIYHLNQAIGEYARTDAKTFTSQIKELKQRAASLEQQLKTSHQKQQASESSDSASKTKKDRGLDRMFDEQAAASAKKKMR